MEFNSKCDDRFMAPSADELSSLLSTLTTSERETILKVLTTSIHWFFYCTLVELPGFARDFYCQLCIFVCLSISLTLPSISPKPNLKYPACWPTGPPLSLTPSLYLSHPSPSLFPDKKFPVEAHFWLDELFYYIEVVY